MNKKITLEEFWTLADNGINAVIHIVYCMALKYSGLSKTQFKKMIDKFILKGKVNV